MRILVASPLDADAVACLKSRHDVVCPPSFTTPALHAAVADREVVVFRSGGSVSSAVIEEGRQLRLLVRAGCGIDNVVVEDARRQGVRVVRVPGASGRPVAEFTFALLLSLVRRVTLADRLLRTGSWPKSLLSGPLLHGKTLGVVGAGNIGATVGEMAAAWGMRAIGCVAHDTPEIRQSLAVRGVTLTSLEEVLEESDFVSVHVPLDETTWHLINDKALRRMQPHAFLVTTARGGVVDEKALHDALAEGRLAGAGLDVHEHEGDGTHSSFAALANVVLTPHIGAMAVDAQRVIGQRVVELIDAFGHGRLDDVVSPAELVV